MVAISRRAYAELYGPTKGDLVRLGDTCLLAEIEHDYTVPGHELVVGAGKTLRDSEGINARMRYSDKALDIVIQNATIIDAELGIAKCRSFDSVWPKNRPNFAQDDRSLRCEFQGQGTGLREDKSGSR